MNAMLNKHAILGFAGPQSCFDAGSDIA